MRRGAGMAISEGDRLPIVPCVAAAGGGGSGALTGEDAALSAVGDAVAGPCGMHRGTVRTTVSPLTPPGATVMTEEEGKDAGTPLPSGGVVPGSARSRHSC